MRPSCGSNLSRSLPTSIVKSDKKTIMASLAPKTGVLGQQAAAHLLRRTTFHPSKTLIDVYATKTVSQAMNDLMTEQPLTNPIPIAYDTGQPWINAETGLRYLVDTDPAFATALTNGQLHWSLRGWWIDEARLDQTALSKFVFFLHSIWVVNIGSEGPPEEAWDYLRLLRYIGFGSYKALAKKMSIDNQMLRYLDNNANTDDNPNENYAREFLELFTIGKGPQIGEGDYTNYQEADVSEGAKLLTGWRNRGRTTQIITADPETGIPCGYPTLSRHETSDKTFSSAFNNQTIVGATAVDDIERELNDYIAMVFNQDETARTIVRRMYQYYVSRNITAEIETDIIEPLATVLRDGDYVMEPVLRQLWSSVHFYDEDDSDSNDEIIGSIIKSPMEKVLQTLNYFQVTIPDAVTDSYNHYRQFYKRCFIDTFGDKGGMNIFRPTNVAGYPAYYQTPVFQRSWFNSSTIVSRYKLPQQLLEGKRLILGGDLGTVQFHIVPFIANSGFFTDPADAQTLVNELTDYLFCKPLSTERRQYFVDQLTGDFDEEYWANLWLYYANTYDEDEVKNPLENLFKALLYSPEFQVM